MRKLSFMNIFSGLTLSFIEFWTTRFDITSSNLIGKNLTNSYCSFSYKFVKGFLAITLLLLVISSWNFHDVCQRL